MPFVFAIDNKRKRRFNSSVIEEAYSSMMSRVEALPGHWASLTKVF